MDQQQNQNQGFNTNIKTTEGGGQDQEKSKKMLLLILALIVVIGTAVYFLLFDSSGSETEMTSQQNVAADNNTGAGSGAVNSGAAAGSTLGGQMGANSLTPVNGSTGSENKAIQGINVNGLFIPSGLDVDAKDFLLSLQGKGQFPIDYDKNALGKVNPFLK